MDNKSKATIIASLALMAAIGAGTIGMGMVADAHRDNLNGQKRSLALSEEQRTKMTEFHNQIEQAIKTNNYKDWKNTIESKSRPCDVVTEENFSRFAEMHNLMEDGKYEEAMAIRDELGISGMGGRMGRGFRGMGMGGCQKNKSLQGNFKDKNNDGICDNMQ